MHCRYFLLHCHNFIWRQAFLFYLWCLNHNRMKKIYLLFTIITAAASSYAQPTLTSANSNPVTGLTFERKSFTPVTGQEGSGGANQTWNWSAVVEDLSATGSYISPIGTDHAAENPTATACLSLVGALEYQRGDNAGLYRLAFYNPAQQLEQVFDIPFKIIAYPFTMNSTYSSSYHANIVGPGFSGTQDGTMTVTADGWGTLITPSGTYTNVLRVHTHVNEVYDYGVMGQIPQTADQYLFIAPNVHYPIGAITWGDQDGSPFSGGIWSTTAVGINEVNASLYKLSVYPNPANDVTSFSYTLKELSSVAISVMDQTGRIVQKSDDEMLQPGKHIFELDAATLSNGIYFVQAIINNERASIKMLVNH